MSPNWGVCLEDGDNNDEDEDVRKLPLTVTILREAGTKAVVIDLGATRDHRILAVASMPLLLTVMVSMSIRINKMTEKLCYIYRIKLTFYSSQHLSLENE